MSSFKEWAPWCLYSNAAHLCATFQDPFLDKVDAFFDNLDSLIKANKVTKGALLRFTIPDLLTRYFMIGGIVCRPHRLYILAEFADVGNGGLQLLYTQQLDSDRGVSFYGQDDRNLNVTGGAHSYIMLFSFH